MLLIIKRSATVVLFENGEDYEETTRSIISIGSTHFTVTLRLTLIRLIGCIDTKSS